MMDAEQWRALTPPSTDINELLNAIGIRLFPIERAIAQYVKWSIDHGVTAALLDRPVMPEDIMMRTDLNLGAIRGLLGILCAAGIAVHVDGRYVATPLARDYISASSPFYIGDELYLTDPIPPYFLKKPIPDVYSLPQFAPLNFGTHERLLNQQVRNLPANLAAVNSGLFAGSKNVLDLAGGSGVFSIPLVLKYPEISVVLAELPSAFPNIAPFIEAAGVGDKISLCPLDAFKVPWVLGKFDTVFIGNFLHGFDDRACSLICYEAYQHLEAGGKIWLHEHTWNDDKSGPMLTALFNLTMALAGGKQRTKRELEELLLLVGFKDIQFSATTGGMMLVGGTKPQAS